MEIPDIFRISVNKREIRLLINEINNTGSLLALLFLRLLFPYLIDVANFPNVLSNLNPHVIASLFLTYLDQLPNGVIFIQTLQGISTV